MFKSTFLWVLVGYLSGSVPFGLLIGFAKGVDIRRAGSGNVGATNTGRVLGRHWGFVCLVLDALKGFLPVLATGLAMGWVGQPLTAIQAWRWLAVATAAMLGHIFPLWLGFRGGKGVATGLGVLLGFWHVLTLPGLVAAGIWLLVAGWTGWVSLASITAAAVIPLLLLAIAVIGGQPWGHVMPFLVCTTALATLVILRHTSNIVRMCEGTEPRIGRQDLPDCP